MSDVELHQAATASPATRKRITTMAAAKKKRALEDPLDQVLAEMANDAMAAAANAGNDVVVDDDAADGSLRHRPSATPIDGASPASSRSARASRSLTSARRAKRARTEALAPDGTVVRTGDTAEAIESDSNYMAQLLLLVDTAVNSGMNPETSVSAAGSASRSGTTPLSAAAASSGSQEGASVDFALTINQPSVLKDMLSSVSAILNKSLPLIIWSGPSFQGVRIDGMNESKNCLITSQFSCNMAYVSANAVCFNGGINREIRAPGGGGRCTERAVRFFVDSKVVTDFLKSVPNQMALRWVKSSRRPEIVWGTYEGTSTMERDIFTVPTLIGENSGGAADPDADNPRMWSPIIDCHIQETITMDAAMLKNVLDRSTTTKCEVASFTIREPGEQIDGRRPDTQLRHVMLEVRVGSGNSANHMRNFAASVPWSEIAVAGGTPATPTLPGGSARSTPTSAVREEGDCSMRSELRATLKLRFCNVYSIKELQAFLKSVHGTISISLGDAQPIIVEHGNDQFKVRMALSPRAGDGSDADATAV